MSPTSSLSSSSFRFGVVTPVVDGVAAWRDEVRRVADLGYTTLLVPDVPGWQPAPGPLLGVAASLTSMNVGTWVSASPLRPASTLAWEAHSLTELTEGRFQLGIGAGRPGIEDLVRELGLPPLTPAQRVDRIREVVRLLREHDGTELHTPVTMAVRGPNGRALAAELADMITFAITPDDRREQIVQLAREFLAVRELPVALHVQAVGETVAPFMSGPDTDPAQLRETDSLAYLPADPAAAAEQLYRSREEMGASFVAIGSNAAEILAPVVAELA
jgi:alkanesulfonate monooxygenase SsuD/methylene tetrahydromethanopterin reductase-like flavin-dependent oxidoreductase (luciferase family)